MSHRRFLPLMACVVLTFGALVLRLYQVQVVENDVWANEVGKLTRRARMIPYLRGRIVDRDGEVFVQDEEAYAVRFVYREFRRDHPLGQIAHARGALLSESVSLQTAALELADWGMALVEAKAIDVERFASGEAVELCGIEFPQVKAGSDRRRSRAAELRFYTRGLLRVSFRDWKAIKKGLDPERDAQLSWLELLARHEGVGVDLLRQEVATRIERSMRRLEQLAVQMEVSSVDGLLAVTPEESLWFLIEALELKRRNVESAIAMDLFVETTGFEPGRLRAEVLLDVIDLEFIAGELGWGDTQTAEWAHEMRRIWIEDRRSFHLPRAAIRARLREGEGESALDAFLGELAYLFARKPRTPRERRAASREWYRIEQPAVFAEMSDLFERVNYELPQQVPLPFLDSRFRGTWARDASLEELAQAMLPMEYAEQVALERPAEAVEDWRGELLEEWQAPLTVDEAVARVLWQLHPSRNTTNAALGGDPSLPRDAEELLPWVGALWEASYRDSLETILLGLRDAAQQQGFPLPFELAEKRIERARKKADYFIRDRGSRPEVIDESPDDSVINRLTRYVDEYRGFQVEPRTRRLAMALDVDNHLVARELIGVVRESTLEEVLEQDPDRLHLSRILTKRDRNREDEARMRDLVGRLYRPDEVHGTSGVEGLMDFALRGTNGYDVNEGLQQREEDSNAKRFKDKVDGLDVQLTLSIELQKAAQETIEHPIAPRTEDTRDDFWFRNPVGAIVFATVDGEILAAASGPKMPHEDPTPRDGERRYNYERTLRMPWFQPMGSIFKPFVAAYALDRVGLLPEQTFECAARPDGRGAGWNKVACHRSWGHGVLNLDEAIRASCNAYFAQVGEMLQSKDHVRDLAHMFGFDRPTGVRLAGQEGGLVEVHRIGTLHQSSEFSLTDLNRAGNGLAVIEATPVQVARGVAGLATGWLPTMRLIRRVGDEEIPPSFEEIPLSQRALETVRAGMLGVVLDSAATGRGLEAEELGFQVAGKTGSADYRPMTPGVLRQLRFPSDRSPEMRKHTWFVGYFPAENPTNVVVVYCHDIGVTATHSAVYVAAQFLKTPEVQAYMQGAMR